MIRLLTAVFAITCAGCLDVTVNQACDVQRDACWLRLDNITPASGPQSGGTRVTIEGSGFDSKCAFRLGEPLIVLSLEPTKVIAVTPAVSDPGPADLNVRIEGTPTLTWINDAFTYTP